MIFVAITVLVYTEISHIDIDQIRKRQWITGECKCCSVLSRGTSKPHDANDLFNACSA